ncbi:hypothetical protein Ciccas_010597 [Cichlidogyrus casuarinus]|uniref:Calreticulin n=1 Tax=Cichlidogyrus casuarinus TaxID=1844966 RepID=A0ABD2PTP0_9PLAT
MSKTRSPDICGISTKKVHVIFTHNGKNHLVKKDIRCKDDELTHMYRLIVKPTNEYEVEIDDESVEKGSLEEDFDILPPKEIEDDSVKKPADWVDEKMMPDENDKKPEDWDKPKTIPDPAAKKPDDWDDEMDGEWEPPQIDNPDYKGDWKAKMIENPDYKGPWIQPKKPNPDYKEDKELYAFEDFGGIGFDLWQVKSGTIFDNLAICDDLDECKKLTKGVWQARQAAEKKVKDEETKKAEEEMEKAQKEAEEKEKAEKAKKDGDEDTDAKKEDKAHDEL